MTLAAARYSSEDAAQVVEYIQAVIDFSKKSKPYHKAKETLKELKIEREKMEKKSQERTLMLSQEVPFEVKINISTELSLSLKWTKKRSLGTVLFIA